ncbi:hypothetical protein [Leisingera sp. JC1]|uniref:hypothetical protein n=1 Tax=Leisingera sp. JC1 TaxID=1855282 RepID=UPI0008080C37|nr:hypothetical protein [Leisingera sp. JC1]OBY28520.1 hypothetical protein A9D60_10765 [Leisingera sp. JC1]
MTRILNWATALLLALTAPLMADNMDHGYYAKIRTTGAGWQLRVNDLHIRKNSDIGLAKPLHPP